jgi:Lhr-like helicase
MALARDIARRLERWLSRRLNKVKHRDENRAMEVDPIEEINCRCMSNDLDNYRLG